MLPLLDTTVTVSGLEENGMTAVLVLLCMIVLVVMLILKFMNLVTFNGFYRDEFIWVTLFTAIICYAFILVGVMVHPITTFAIYLNASHLFFVLLWILWTLEMVVNAAKKAMNSSNGRMQTQYNQNQ